METGSCCVPEKSNCVEYLIEMILVVCCTSLLARVLRKRFFCLGGKCAE
jgi:hypothetical protein